MAWIENGPVSLPPRPVAYLAATAVFLLAIGGAGLGFWNSSRNGERPTFDVSDQAPSGDQAVLARPIVEIPALQPPVAAVNTVAASNAASSDSNDDDSSADSNDIASETAAAQAVQSRPSKSANIDDILTSRSEKPQPPAKPSTDEGAPPSDVPF